jgi:hypothetical protein
MGLRPRPNRRGLRAFGAVRAWRFRPGRRRENRAVSIPGYQSLDAETQDRLVGRSCECANQKPERVRKGAFWLLKCASCGGAVLHERKPKVRTGLREA